MSQFGMTQSATLTGARVGRIGKYILTMRTKGEQTKNEIGGLEHCEENLHLKAELDNKIRY